MRINVVLFLTGVLISLFVLVTAEGNNTPRCVAEKHEISPRSTENVNTTDIGSSSAKARINNWSDEWRTFFKNLTTREENSLKRKLNAFKNFLIAILDWIPFKIQIIFLELMKIVCGRGLPRPFNIVAVLCIDKFIIFLETRKKDFENRSKEKNMLINMGAIRNQNGESGEVRISSENDSENIRILKMMAEFSEKLEKVYLIMMNRVIQTYLNNFFKNLIVSRTIT